MKRDTGHPHLHEEFSRTVEKHKNTIYTVCYMFAEDRETARDLIQEVLVNIWTGLEKLWDTGNPGAWIWRVSLNTCISYERKRRRRPETLPMETVDSLFEDTDEDSKQARMLHERIKKLGIFDRAILLLWLEDLTYREIGEIMGISADNVSVRLVRIREKMKNMK